MEEELITVHVIVKGRVQGVGMRATAQSWAENLGLTGTAANTSDGSVEIYVQGSQEKIDSFLSRLDHEFFIDETISNFVSDAAVFSDFRILRN